MPVTFVKRSSLPVTRIGKAGSMSITISGNGQVSLSKLATEALKGAARVAIGFDAATGTVALYAPSPRIEKLLPKKEDWVTLRHAKKGVSDSFAGSAILRDKDTFGAHLYDFKASGNQTFAVAANEKEGCITFSLPKGKLTPKPVVPRKKKAAVPAAGAVAPAAPATDEPILEPA